MFNWWPCRWESGWMFPRRWMLPSLHRSMDFHSMDLFKAVHRIQTMTSYTRIQNKNIKTKFRITEEKFVFSQYVGSLSDQNPYIQLVQDLFKYFLNWSDIALEFECNKNSCFFSLFCQMLHLQWTRVIYYSTILNQGLNTFSPDPDPWPWL